MSSEEDIDEAQEYSDNFDLSPQPSRHLDPTSSSGSDMYQLSSSSTLLSVSKSDKSSQPRAARGGFREDEELNGLLPGARYSDSSGSSSMEAMKLSGGSYEAGDGPMLRSPEVTAKRDGNQTIEEQPNEENEANSEASHHTPEDARLPPPPTQSKRLENAQKALASLSAQRPATGEKSQSTRKGVPRNKNYRLGTNQFPAVTKTGKAPEEFGAKSSIPKPGKALAALGGNAEDRSASREGPIDGQFKTVLADKTKQRTKQVNEFQDYQTQLIKKEREYKASPEPKAKPQSARKSPPKVAPQPRALGANLYKLHQLAESMPGKGQRMTLESLSGSLLEVIRVMSGMISEDFKDEEVAQELKSARKCLSLMQTGSKDCVRNEKDYLEDTKTRTETYRTLLEEHQAAQAEILRLQTVLTEGNKKLGTVEAGKAVVKMGNGTYVRAGLLPNSALSMKLESGNSTTSPPVDLLRDDPVDAIVNKIERSGFSLPQVFDMIDVDGDRVLTLTEIKEQVPKLGKELELTEEELGIIMKKLDENSDGIVTIEEFLGLLDPRLAVQKEYRALIGDLDANDPIIIEEMILDMRMRGKLYQTEMPTLVNEYKKNLPNEQRLVKRILLLEQKMNEKKIEMKPTKESTKILTHQVNTLRFQKEETQSTLSSNLQLRQSEVQRTQGTLAARMQQRTSLQLQISKNKAESSYSQKQLEGLETMKKTLNSRNQLIAAMMIQAVVKRWKQRRKFKVELTTKRHAARIIQRRFREHRLKQKETAATVIQANFRRIKAQKQHEELKRKKMTEKPPTRKPLSPEPIVQLDSGPAEPSFAPSQEEHMMINASQTFSFLESKDQIQHSESPIRADDDPSDHPIISSEEYDRSSKAKALPLSTEGQPDSLTPYEDQELGLEEEDIGNIEEERTGPRVCAVCAVKAERECSNCRADFCALCFENEHYDLRKPHQYVEIEDLLTSSFTPEELDLIANVKLTFEQAKADPRIILKMYDESDSGLMSTDQLLEALKTRKLRLSDSQVADLLELAYAHFYNESSGGYDYHRLSAIL